MLELRERNGKKHIVAEEEKMAFAWAGYYANCSNILINGTEYTVVHVTDAAIDFNDGTSLPVGCYAIFKSDNKTIIYDDHELRELRKNNPLDNHIYCFDDVAFLKTTWLTRELDGSVNMKRYYYWCKTCRGAWIIKCYTKEEAKWYRERSYHDMKLIG